MHNLSMLYRASDLKKIFGESAKYLFFDNNFIINSVIVDSRISQHNSLFFAIKGEKSDGINFLKNAFFNGTICVITTSLPSSLHSFVRDNKINIIIVNDVLQALHKIANWRRNMVNPKVIGVTGSVGKTSTTKAIASTLSNFFTVTVSPKSFNNHVGLPLTLANLPSDSKIAILEMGMNHPGEIELLSKIAEPDIAMITNIGPSHIGNFDSVEHIAICKSEICSHLKPGGIVILNEESEFFDTIKNNIINKYGVKNIFRVGKENSHMFISDFDVSNELFTNFNLITNEGKAKSSFPCRIFGLGVHRAVLSLFVFAICRLFKIDLNEVASLLYQLPIIEGRGNLETAFYDKKKVLIVNDTYNSSPYALKNSIKTINIISEQRKVNRKVCILGDMLELGSNAEEYHTLMKDIIIESKIDIVHTVGAHMKLLNDQLPENIRGQNFKHVGELCKKIRSLLQDGDVVLFKGSRAIELDRAIIKLCH